MFVQNWTGEIFVLDVPCALFSVKVGSKSVYYNSHRVKSVSCGLYHPCNRHWQGLAEDEKAHQ